MALLLERLGVYAKLTSTVASTDQTIHKDPIATYLSNPEEVRAMRPSEQYDFCDPEPVKVEVQVRLNQAVENAWGGEVTVQARTWN